MARAKMNKRTWFKFAMIGSMVVALSATVLMTLIIKESKEQIMVPITTADIVEGEKLKPDKITEVPIGKHNLPENMITNIKDLNGKYATRAYGPNEYLFASALTENYMKKLQEKAKYGAVAISVDLVQAANADIAENDFVRVLIVTKDDGSTVNTTAGTTVPDGNTAIIYSEELSAVRVLGVYDASSGSVEPKKDSNRENEKELEADIQNVTPKMIVFDALPIQQALLVQAEYSGKIHIVVHPKEVQDTYRKVWGLIDENGAAIKPDPENDRPLTLEEQERKIEELQNIHLGTEGSDPLPTKESTTKEGTTKDSKTP